MRYFKFFLYASVVIFALNIHSAEAASESSSSLSRSISAVEQRDYDSAIAYAQSSNNNLVWKITAWYMMSMDDGGGFDASTIATTLQQNAGWPLRDKIQANAEKAMLAERTYDTAISFFSSVPPATGDGKLVYAMAQFARGSATTATIPMLKEGFRDASLMEQDALAIYQQYSEYLSIDDLYQRAARLLWQEKTRDAETLLPYVAEDKQQLLRARISVIKTGNMPAISSALQSDSGLLFDRIKIRDDKKDDSGVQRLLLEFRDSGLKPELLWRIRNEQIRKAITSRNYGAAYKIASMHGLTKGEDFARAEFLSGWVALRFLRDARKACEHFAKLHEGVGFPVSKARAAFWAGEAATASGDATVAGQWYSEAAKYPTTYFGQQATSKLGWQLSLPARDSGDPSGSIMGDERAQAAVLLAQSGNENLAKLFVFAIQNESNDINTHRLAALLWRNSGNQGMIVKSAKNSQRKNIILMREGYPIVNFTPPSDVERALVHAVARQESEFDPYAASHAGATGLLQLMPATARNVARKNGMDYSPSKLTDPEYNLTLGSYYLEEVLNRYDGNKVMALAAYNAGPGRVSQWIEQYGDPRYGSVTEYDWVEMIPFEETRNYVHRVLENYNVYSTLIK